ncbi:serine/threonine-protein kinase [Antricoccus suffuscus]|nr:serine/threonine-protein kinase [Antricoccus suffuscus]
MSSLPEIAGLSDLSVIGQGGSGVVYRGIQDQLRRVVAVKLLATRLDATTAERFAREGHALGMVSGHPNIVPVYLADTTSAGEPYLVMQLCEGGALSDRVEYGGPMPYAEVLDLGVRMCGALQTAHDAGILHRDIKPANVLFDGYGVPRLADFGQAQHADVRLTRTGEVVATPGFAAPEVLRGAPATARSDVYSLATTLLAALLGHAPFTKDTDENIAATLLRVVQDPPPDARVLGVPDQVAWLLEHAMDKEPQGRPSSAGEFGQALQGVQMALGLAQTPLIIAARPATGVLPHRDGRQPTREFPSNGTTQARPGPQQTMVAPQYSSAPRSGTAPLHAPINPGPPGISPKPRRSGATKWIISGVALLVVLALGVWLTVLVNSQAEVKAVSNPGAILVGGADFGPDWSATDGDSLVSSVLGSLPEGTWDKDNTPSPSSLMDCIDVTFDGVKSAKASAMYVKKGLEPPANKDAAKKGAHYLMGRSEALLTDSDKSASDIVEAFSSPGFDTCLDEARNIGVTVANESTMYNATPKLDVPYTAENANADIPDVVTMQSRSVAIVLSQRAGDSEVSTDNNGDPKAAGYRYVTILAMSAGKSLVISIFQGDQQDLPDGLLDNVATAFIGKSTK